MNLSSSDIHWEEKINRWNLKNRSLQSFILAKVYEDIKIGRERQNESKPVIAKTLSTQCIPDCESRNGYVVADSGRHYKCGCIHHTLFDTGSN